MWNYRVIRHNDELGEWYGIHKVYYDKNGQPIRCDEEPVSVMAYTPGDIITMLGQMMRGGSFSWPVLNFEDFRAGE